MQPDQLRPWSTAVTFNGGEIRLTEHGGRQVAYMPDVARTFGLRSDNVVPTLDPWDYVSVAPEAGRADSAQ